MTVDKWIQCYFLNKLLFIRQQMQQMETCCFRKRFINFTIIYNLYRIQKVSKEENSSMH